MPQTPAIILEQRRNTLFVHCPTLIALREMREFLTFQRTVKERVQGKFVVTQNPEPCYKQNENRLVLECTAGFADMIAETFSDRYDVEIRRTMSRRVRDNTVPDWSKLGNVTFRPRQRDILELLVNSDRGSVIVPTAVGKSFIISQYAKIMTKARIIVSTSSKSVLEQLYDDLKRAVPGEVGIKHSSHRKNTDARIVCVSQGTLPSYCGESQNIDIFVGDEFHELGTEKRIEVLRSVKEARMFGFSANEFRPDGAEFLLNGIFGPVLFRMDYPEAVGLGLVTPICVVWVPVKSDRDPASYYMDHTAKERHGMWRFRQRNMAIAKAARLFDPDDQVLIPAKTLDQALHIRQLLPEFTVAYAKQDAHSATMQKYIAMGLTQGMPPMTDERLKTLKTMFSEGKLTKVIATSVWSRGVNFPALSVILRADGTNSCIADTQWPGRASRIYDGKEISLLFDFTDEYNSAFRYKALERRRRYAKNGWTQMTWDELQRIINR